MERESATPPRGECFRGELTALGLVCNTLTAAQPLPLVAILSGCTSRLVTQDKQRGRREPARVLPTVEWGHDGPERSASPSRFTDLQQLWFRSSNPTSTSDAEEEIQEQQVWDPECRTGTTPHPRASPRLCGCCWTTAQHKRSCSRPNAPAATHIKPGETATHHNDLK